ncbi:hypothetical protein M0K88_004894 [Escherichia coli]|nr:hypothetical protein [Escherichia coli]
MWLSHWLNEDVNMEGKHKLPDGAYEALAGLKAQAGAAMLLLPGNDVAKGKKVLKIAHAQIAANEVWVKKIVSAILGGDVQTTVATADDAWLERTFSEITH